MCMYIWRQKYILCVCTKIYICVCVFVCMYVRVYTFMKIEHHNHKPLSQKTFWHVTVWKAQVNNTLNDGWISYSYFSLRVLILFLLAHCHTVMAFWDTWIKLTSLMLCISSTDCNKSKCLLWKWPIVIKMVATGHLNFLLIFNCGCFYLMCKNKGRYNALISVKCTLISL